MARCYNAFLIRHWTLDDEQGERTELTHLQSGERTRVAALAEALAWIKAREVDSATARAGGVPRQGRAELSRNAP